MGDAATRVCVRTPNIFIEKCLEKREKGLWVSFEPMIRSKLGCCRRVWRTCWVRWKHLCFFVHQIVERLDLNAVENSYSDEGQPGYDPRLLLKLWLYAYCLAVTSSRRLEQRTRED